MTAGRSDVMERAVGCLADVLGVPRDRIDVRAPLTSLGLESFTAVRFRRRLAQDLGLKIGLADLLGSASVTSVVASGTTVVEQQQPDRWGLESVGFELTPIQQAYLVGRHPELPLGGVATYFYQEYDRPAGDDPLVEVRCLERAWMTVVGRHPSLRLTIGDDHRGRFGPAPQEIAFSQIDLREESPAEIERVTAERTHQLSHRVLPVDGGRLWDIAVTLLPGLIRMHIGFDVLGFDLAGWFAMLDEWRRARDGSDLGPPPGKTFADFLAARESDPEHRRHRADDETYWQQESLPGHGPSLPWQLDPVKTRQHRFVRARRVLRAEQWSTLQAVAARQGLSPTGVLLASCALVMDRWSAGGDFCLNTTLFDRSDLLFDDSAGPATDFRDVMGDYTSTVLVAIRTPDLQHWNGFGQFAHQVNRRYWEDLSHRAAPPGALRRDHDADVSAVPYPVVFTSGLGLSDAGHPGDWLGTVGYGISQTPQVLIDHIVWEEQGDLVIAWDFVENALAAGRLESMADAHLRLLELLVDEHRWSDVRLGWVPDFRDEPELHRRDDVGPLLHDPVRAAARRFPDRPALLTADDGMSHGELDRRAGHLAHRLLEAGVRVGDLVGLSTRRGLDQVVAQRGILAAGAGYIPVEPDWPQDRAASIVEQSGLRFVLVDDLHDARFGPDVTVLPAGPVASPDASTSDPAPAAAPPQQAAGDAPAYVIFTSGSTGRPKGVAVDHRAVRATIDELWTAQHISAEDRVLALSAFSFDLNVYDLFCVPAEGGAVVLPDQDRYRDPGHWLELMAQHRVTIWNSAPALMEMLVEYAEIDPDLTRSALADLRLVMLSADWIPVTLPDRIRAWAPQAQVVSLGGATEASIWSISHPIDEVPADWPSIPYGRALAGQSFDILDGNGAPTRVGVAGQLHIGGQGLAKGYLGDPAQTAQAFFVHPTTGRRLYRTGDLGRWRSDGSIRFLGRADRQVKIRGHRIELGEVESVLDRHPAVRVSVAKAVTGPDDRPRLVAYVVPERQVVDGDVWADEDDLIRTLRESVPEFMVPSRFLLLDALPQTPNGKVDHAALANPYGRADRPAGSAPGATATATPRWMLRVILRAPVPRTPSSKAPWRKYRRTTSW